MTHLLRALSAEVLKTRRTLALWMAVLTPVIVCFVQAMILLRWKGPFGGAKVDAWHLFLAYILELWTGVALPLFITLETALLAHTEHGEKQWKHLFALPVPRWAYYAAKWLVTALLVLLGEIVLAGGTVLAGYAVRWLKPALDLGPVAPVGLLVRTLLLVYLISLLILSIHTWVALRFRSFTVSVGVGMAAAVVNIMVFKSEDAMRYYPWALPLNALPELAALANIPYALAVGMLGGLVVAVAGTWETGRRDVL